MLILAFYFFLNICLILCNFNINDEVLFGISWKDEILKKDSLRGITIHSKDKESFRCLIPSHVRDKYDNSFDDYYNGPSELELLQPLFGNKLCSVKIESYWTYEICHGRHVRQYHEETTQGKSVTLQQYFLGTVTNLEKVKESSTPERSPSQPKAGQLKQLPTITINSVNFPYFKVNMTNGTQCDLIGNTRSINILYVCQMEGRGEVYEIQEVRTCQYQAVVFTKLLCSHPGYKITDNLVNEIACYPLNSSPSMPKSLSLLQDEIKSEMNSISTLDGLFSNTFNMGTQIKVEPFKENGIIVYRIKTISKQAAPKSEESSEDFDDISGNNENAESMVPEKSTPKIEKETTEHPKSSSLGGNPTSEAALLQRFLSGKFCVDGGEGWWRHRVCYNRKIIQYHVEMHIETSEIILGLWVPNNHLKWLRNNPDKKPLSEPKDRLEIYQYFSDGSYCDEIKSNRDAILRIRCSKDNSSAILISFLEPSVCSYIITIESSLFCSMVKEADEFGLLKPTEE